MSFVYGIQSGLFIKVGWTNNVKERMRQMALYNPHPCKLVFKKYCPEPYFMEKQLHQLLDPHAIGREWFVITPQQLKDAYKIAEKTYAERRRAQFLWEQECEARIAAKELRKKMRKCVPDVENVVSLKKA